MDAELERSPRPSPSRVSGKRALTREQNRRQILDAARVVFSELGYGATTVRHIIRATPLASGTFYNYFKSKEEVFEAMRDETALAMRPALRDARRKADTMEGFIEAAFRSYFAHVAGEGARAATSGPGAYVRVDTPQVVAGFKELREDVEDAVARGLLPVVDAEFLAAAMVGVAFELAEALQKREKPDLEAATRFATALFLGGLAALAKPG